MNLKTAAVKVTMSLHTTLSDLAVSKFSGLQSTKLRYRVFFHPAQLYSTPIVITKFVFLYVCNILDNKLFVNYNPD